jgi:hypothetical protein
MHGQRLGESSRNAPGRERIGPPRCQQHQPAGGHHRQGETEARRHPRVVQHQQHHRGGQRRECRPLPPDGQRDQTDRAHHAGPQHARLRPGQYHEPDQRQHRARRRAARTHPQRPQQQQHRDADDREVGPAHGQQVRHPGRLELLLHVLGHAVGVADDQRRHQASRLRVEHRGGLA